MTPKTLLAVSAGILLSTAAMAQNATVGMVDRASTPLKLVHMARPVYPAEAKAASLSGIVRVEAVVGRDGKVAGVEPLSGHPLLVAAGLEAVRQWEYAPPEAQATVQITLNFGLDIDTGAAQVPGSVQQARLKDMPRPVYPAEAKEKHIAGIVRLRATISPEGVVTAVRVLDGAPVLVEAAVDAVRQWRYEPAIVGGAASVVVTDIDVNFTLSPNENG